MRWEFGRGQSVPKARILAKGGVECGRGEGLSRPRS